MIGKKSKTKKTKLLRITSSKVGKYLGHNLWASGTHWTQEYNQGLGSVFSGGALVHTVPSWGHSVKSGPERSGAGHQAAGAAGGPQRDRLLQVPPAVQSQWVHRISTLSLRNICTKWWRKKKEAKLVMQRCYNVLSAIISPLRDSILQDSFLLWACTV